MSVIPLSLANLVVDLVLGIGWLDAVDIFQGDVTSLEALSGFFVIKLD